MKRERENTHLFAACSGPSALGQGQGGVLVLLLLLLL